jgi:(1->4)-alpha-D-glucan 1-alpha-D-glucosylmutase
MSTLSTHDTKRSEDVRARINVLSEIPAKFQHEAARWHQLNAGAVDGRAPSPNEEWLLYQTLIGVYPVEAMDRLARETFVERIQAYMIKAMREAKVSTSWIAPNEEHEKAVLAFVAAILAEGSPFLAALESFQRPIAASGLINSLAQTLLKLAAPGMPDTYQGTELLDFSLVDPDNRRPVDYVRRQTMLRELKRDIAAAGDGLADFAGRLADTAEDGRAKLYVTWRLLTLRREMPGLFTTGDYLPIEFTGGFAFARRQGDRTAIVGVSLSYGDRRSAGLRLPDSVGRGDYRNIFTGEQTAVGDSLSAADLFHRFPVALLLS